MHIPLRKGMLLKHQNHLFFVEDFHERHTGQQKPTVHVRLKDLKDGHHVERVLDDLLPVKEVDHAYRAMQYTFRRVGVYVFMDAETFDEHEFPEAMIGGFKPFLREGQEFRVMFADGQPVYIEFPEHVSLHVTTTAAAERSVGQGGSVLKEAELENKLTVHVPLFIKTGDLIRVDTRDRTYAGKEKEA
jgi:elongation factor P